MFLDRVWFVNENMILFKFQSNIILMKLNNTMTKESLKSVVSIDLFYGWVIKETLHQPFKT